MPVTKQGQRSSERILCLSPRFLVVRRENLWGGKLSYRPIPRITTASTFRTQAVSFIRLTHVGEVLFLILGSLEE